MNIINNKTISVSTNNELKEILENNNTYEYIYLDNDITLENGININPNKKKILINGTYQNTLHTLTSMDSIETTDTITATSKTLEITLKNIRIINTNPNGIIYIPESESTENTIVSFDNISFNGTSITKNINGVVKINNSIITIENINNIESQDVCESTRVIVSGKTNITSNSSNYPLFSFNENALSPYIVFQCKSNIILSTDTRELMTGTNRLNFTILHDTNLHLTTGNGFSPSPDYGANNVLIDERASFTFIEKSHQRIPMWAIFGSLTMKEDSELQVINSYSSTPSDNFNLHFKGSNCSINLNNPKSFVMYTKNSNVLYTDNILNFNITCSRINMWDNATELSYAGDIDDLPNYSWYKENDLLKVNGIITSSLTSITSYNLTTSELKNLSDIGNFNFLNKKQFSIGTTPMNIHPINSSSNKISGHTTSFADVLIKYNNTIIVVSADIDGLFEYTLPTILQDNTKIELTSNVMSSFIYGTRTITTPFTGELTLLEGNSSIDFSQTPITNTKIFPKTKELVLKIVDSRTTSSDWKLYAYINNPLTSINNFKLEKSLIFKKLDNTIITLSTTPEIVYIGNNNQGNVSYNEITWSTEKGPLLDLTNDALEINEEYFSTINFYLEE